MILLRLILRLIVIAFALCVALLGASMFIGFGLAMGMFPEMVSSDPNSIFNIEEESGTIFAVITFILGVIAGFQIAGLAMLPVVVAIAVSELMHWRGLVAQLVLSGLCALFVMFSALQLPQGQLPGDGTVIVSLAAGFVAGFLYWMIAGHRAGKWMGETVTPQEPVDVMDQVDNQR